MEKATLRPVPIRPPGPVDHAEAAAHVAAALPDLDDAAARALALVEIAGRPRSEVATAIALAPDALAAALARARKALRRTIFPLSASGWCERAERMISDRIDGELRAPGPRRLEVHLENCDRCVEHDRRLAQARDQLVRDFIAAHPHADVAPLTERAAAGLRVVRPTLVEAAPVPAGPVVPAFAGPSTDPVASDAGAPPAPTFAGPDDGWTPPPVEHRAADADPRTEDLPADPPLIEREIAPAEPADATPSESEAEPSADPPVEETDARLYDPPELAAAESADEAAAPSALEPAPPAAAPVEAEAPLEAPAPVTPVPTPLRSPALLVWNGLYGAAVLLAVLTVVLLVLAIAGVERVV